MLGGIGLLNYHWYQPSVARCIAVLKSFPVPRQPPIAMVVLIRLAVLVLTVALVSRYAPALGPLGQFKPALVIAVSAIALLLALSDLLHLLCSARNFLRTHPVKATGEVGFGWRRARLAQAASAAMSVGRQFQGSSSWMRLAG